MWHLQSTQESTSVFYVVIFAMLFMFGNHTDLNITNLYVDDIFENSLHIGSVQLY